MEAEKKRIRLDEVTLMRTILALLIVFMHAFTCYQGGWAQPEGFVDIPVYKWIARTSFAFTLEAFVFISGYLFAFQRITLNRIEGRAGLIISKLKRLILPNVIFSALYFPLFYEYKGIPDLLYNLINGCGHMWFLPMLFWCFIGAWLLEQIKVGDVWKLAFLACLNLFFFFSLPLQITKATSYLFYFYGGFVVYKHSAQIKEKLQAMHLVWGWIIFVIAFIALRPLKETFEVGDSEGIINKVFTLSGRSACQLVYASIGTVVFYITAIYYTQRNQLKPFTIKLASCCFGIYLFQQFLLKGLYYKTSFAVIVGPYWLPWLGFIIAAPASYIIAYLLLKTKPGKYLVG